MTTVVSLLGIDPIRIGGTETYVRELSLQLDRIGWRHVAVFTAEPVERVARYLALPNLSIEVVPRIDGSAWDAIPGVVRVLRKYRADVVHLSFLRLLTPLPWVVRACGARKIFVTDQVSRPPGYVPRQVKAWQRVIARTILEPVDAFFGVSDFNCRVLKQTGLIDPNRSHRIHNSIYLPSLEDAGARAAAFRSRFGIPADRPLVAQISWIIPEKGVPDFLDAAHMVLDQRPNVHFALIGSGDYMKEYQQRARELGIADHVTWTGLIESPVEDGVYAAGDVFCMPSRWQEAFGWVITEAMAFEKPVIGSAIGGIPEIIDDGVNGYLIPSGSVKDLADRMLRLLDDPEARCRMGKAARRAVEEKFSLPKAVSQLIEHYTAGSRVPLH